LKYEITIRLNKIKPVAANAATHKPAHTARPIAAVAHMFAAVVSHLVFKPIFKIAQAHKNQTPDTTCAAILPGSLTVALYISGNMILIIINKHDHKPINICVLIPAGSNLYSLSNHIIKAKSALINSLNIISDVDNISIEVVNISIFVINYIYYIKTYI
jgi:hypothetical protein